MYMLVSLYLKLLLKSRPVKGGAKNNKAKAKGFLAVDNPADLAIEAIRGFAY